MAEKINITKKFLIKEYIKNEKSHYKIAEETNYPSTTIWRHLKKYKIKIRTKSEAGKLKIGKYKNILTKKFLLKEYSKNKKSLSQIAKQIGCDKKVVYNYLKLHNIPRRTKSETKKGNKNPNYKDGRKNATYYCIDCGKKITVSSGFYGSGRCRSCAWKKLWQNKNFSKKTLKAIFKALKLKPNKSEKLLNKMLNQLLPNQYKFVGDGKVILGSFCPDFINCNGKKKIIELYGDYWHNLSDWKKRDKRRLIAYNKLGYKTLIIWEHELKDLTKVKEKILLFHQK